MHGELVAHWQGPRPRGEGLVTRGGVSEAGRFELERTSRPDRHGGEARASVVSLRLWSKVQRQAQESVAPFRVGMRVSFGSGVLEAMSEEEFASVAI